MALVLYVAVVNTFFRRAASHLFYQYQIPVHKTDNNRLHLSYSAFKARGAPLILCVDNGYCNVSELQ